MSHQNFRAPIGWFRDYEFDSKRTQSVSSIIATPYSPLRIDRVPTDEVIVQSLIAFQRDHAANVGPSNRKPTYAAPFRVLARALSYFFFIYA